MRGRTILRLLLAATSMLVAPAFAVGMTSASYAIPFGAVNSGVGDMASASYKLSSSLGDSFHTGASASPGYQVNPGFWGEKVGSYPLCLLDIDGDNVVNPLTDGLMLLRAMAGQTGDAVTAGATNPSAPRKTWAEIQPYIHLGALDLDGNGSADTMTDGLMLLRAMFGYKGNAVTFGAVAANNPPRATWAQVRDYLNSRCGTSYQ